MNRASTKILISILIIISLVCIGCLLLFSVPFFIGASLENSGYQPSSSASISLSTIATRELSNGDFTIKIPNIPNHYAFNSYVETEAQKWLNAFASAATKSEAPTENIGFSLDYEITYVSSKFISIKFEGYQYLGGAHPLHPVYTLNYNLNKNRPLKLTDIFHNQAQALNQLSKLSRVKANQYREGSEQIFIEGTEPTLSNFSLISVDSQNLIVTFSEYQIGAYAIGTPAISIPHSELSNLYTQEFKSILGINN